MDKKRIKNDIGLIACMCGYMGDHMKEVDPDKIITDEEMKVVDMYAELAFAIGNLDDAVNALPD